MASAERLRVLQVCPRPWGDGHEISEFIAEVSNGLAERGHSVVVATPSESRAEVRAARDAITAAGDDASSLYESGVVNILAVGQTLPLPNGPRRRPPPLPLDLRRTLERLLDLDGTDFVHVHDPFAPGAGSIALRHSKSLNVASFHEPAERAVATQVTRPLVELLFARLDGRTASYRATADLMVRHFPGDYELVGPGSDAATASTLVPRRPGTPRIAYIAAEERGALRLLARGLRRLLASGVADWELVVWAPEELDAATRLGKRVGERATVVGPSDGPPEGVLVDADIACFASGGVMPIPARLQDALAARAVPVASGIPVYEEVADFGARGALFPPGDSQTLAAQLGRLLSDGELRSTLAANGRRAGERTWSQVAGELEALYGRIASRRHDPSGKPGVRRRLQSRQPINCDLHMHTDHSPDCATPVQTLLETAKERGLGAIAITDHNEISGALEAREIAERIGGIKVIVAEEIKTASEGEVIGLFLERKIERGLTMAETIAEIRRQGGLVYVPHPFDRLHAVPDYEHLLEVVEEIDILEVFNPRVAIASFNEEAVRFAGKYRIVPGAGSDSHVAQGLGSVVIRLADFEGPEEFLEAMREADIVRKHKNMVYVQALKFLQTSGGRGGRSLAGRERPGPKRKGGRSRSTSRGKS